MIDIEASGVTDSEAWNRWRLTSVKMDRGTKNLQNLESRLFQSRAAALYWNTAYESKANKRSFPRSASFYPIESATGRPVHNHEDPPDLRLNRTFRKAKSF